MAFYRAPSAGNPKRHLSNINDGNIDPKELSFMRSLARNSRPASWGPGHAINQLGKSETLAEKQISEDEDSDVIVDDDTAEKSKRDVMKEELGCNPGQPGPNTDLVSSAESERAPKGEIGALEDYDSTVGTSMILDEGPHVNLVKAGIYSGTRKILGKELKSIEAKAQREDIECTESLDGKDGSKIRPSPGVSAFKTEGKTSIGTALPRGLAIALVPKSSILNRIKKYIEDSTKESWDWWPLEQYHDGVKPGFAPVQWRCVGVYPQSNNTTLM